MHFLFCGNFSPERAHALPPTELRPMRGGPDDLRAPVMRRIWAAVALAVAVVVLLATSSHAQQGRGDLGAKLVTVTPELARERHLSLSFGAMITQVTQGGAAARANIVAGDVIQSLNERPVLRAEDVQTLISGLVEGTEIRITLARGPEVVQAKLTLAAAAPGATLLDGEVRPTLMLDTGGHMALVKGLAFTRDGRAIVSAGDDKVVRVSDWRSGKTLRTIRGDVGPGNAGKIYAIALSPDQHWLAVAGSLGDTGAQPIRIYDFDTGRLTRLLSGHTDIINALAFAADSKRLISGSRDTTAIVWDVESGRSLQRLTGHRGELYAVGFSPDADLAITGSFDNSLRLWRTDDGRLIKEMQGHADKVFSLAVRRSDGVIASGDFAGEIRLWDGRSGQFLRTLARQTGRVRALAFSPDGTKLLSVCSQNCGGRNFAHVFDATSGKEIATYAGHDNSVLAAAISPDGKFAATAGGNTSAIHLWELATGRGIVAPDGRPVVLTGTGAPAWSVGFSADGRRIAWGNAQTRISPTDRGPLQFQLRLPAMGEAVTAPEPLSEATTFVRGNSNRAGLSLVHRPGGAFAYAEAVLDIRRGERTVVSLERDRTSGYAHQSYSFSPDSRVVISGGGGGQLFAFDLAELESKGGTLRGGDFDGVAHAFVGHEGDVWAEAPSPDGRYLVSGSADQTVRLWNLKTRELIVTLFRGANGEWALWTPQGYYAASPNGEALVGWNLNRGADKDAQWVSAEQLRGT
ncbi:MAG TPA: PDZ domain-containing protein, partial [Roseiarcus sp.]|nr:PDZ domain-containing protein [Roseiarcus sp.]